MAETIAVIIALAKVVMKVKYLRAILLICNADKLNQVQPTYIDSTIVWVDNTATLAVTSGTSASLGV